MSVNGKPDSIIIGPTSMDQGGGFVLSIKKHVVFAKKN
jgi:hypothetical protein